MKASLAKAGILSWLLLASPCLAWAWGVDFQLPPAAPVVDEFGLLNADDFQQLDSLVRSIKQKSGVEVTVFIPSSLRGREIEDFSIAVAEQWKLGRKKEDKGLLLIVAPKERKMRFEVGYGLEGDLTDVFTRRVLDQEMRPRFRQGDYYEGIVAALYAIQEKVPLGIEDRELENARSEHVSPVFVIFLVFFFVLFFFFSIFGSFVGGRRHYGGGSWGGGGWSGGGGGGSWGGGGGGFGGGGSSSSW